jgi:hypothetical protein
MQFVGSLQRFAWLLSYIGELADQPRQVVAGRVVTCLFFFDFGSLALVETHQLWRTAPLVLEPIIAIGAVFQG